MRRECAICGTFYCHGCLLHHRWPRRTLLMITIRYRNSGWIMDVKTSPALSPNGQLIQFSLYYYWICRFLPLRPKWTVRIAMPSHPESKSVLTSRQSLKSQDCLHKPREDIVLHRIQSPDCFALALTQKHASPIAQLIRSASSNNARQQNPTGQAARCPQETWTPFWEKAKPFAPASCSCSDAS